MPCPQCRSKNKIPIWIFFIIASLATFFSGIFTSLDLVWNSRFQRFSNTYFLIFQIVYHSGEDVSDGHYVTEFNHPSLGWLHCDKGFMSSMPQRLRNSVPYILFYQNIDTLFHDPNSPTLKSQDQLKKNPKNNDRPHVKFEPIFCHYVQRMYLHHYVFNA